jgi:quercetin dioxygenase-like cupin family protein
MTNFSYSFNNTPPTKIGFDEPVATALANGTPPEYAPGYALQPGEGPAVWFRNSLVTMKARARDTDGHFSLMEWYAPRGMCAPGHLHPNESEFFNILEGEVDITCGDTVYHGTPGSYIYIPRSTVHDIQVTTASARFTVLATPGGFERWFEELGEPALAPTFPYTDHRAATLEEMVATGEKYGWTRAQGKTTMLPGTAGAPEPVGRLERDED